MIVNKLSAVRFESVDSDVFQVLEMRKPMFFGHGIGEIGHKISDTPGVRDLVGRAVRIHHTLSVFFHIFVHFENLLHIAV